MALAEEFLDAAHAIAPLVSLSRTEENIRAYEKLISTGLACLDTSLRNVRLSPRVEANIRLRYASVLYEETENFMEAEIALSKGIALCDRVCLFACKPEHSNMKPEPLLRPEVRDAASAGAIYVQKEPKSVAESFR